MFSNFTTDVFLGIAVLPFVYYLLVLFSSWRFFSQSPTQNVFTPPVSVLKPIRGLDPEAYENFASFCRQDYPEYELLFCVHDQLDPAVPVLEKLARDFSACKIKVFYGS